MKYGQACLIGISLLAFAFGACVDLPEHSGSSREKPIFRPIGNASNAAPGTGSMITGIMADLGNPRCSDEDFSLALAKLAQLPVVERPEPWISMVDNTNLPPARRRACFYQLLRRHVPPGTKIQNAALLFRRTNWIREETITCANSFAHFPSEPRSGECVYRLQLPFMRREFNGVIDNGGVYFYITPGRVSGARLLLLLNLKDTETIYDIIITRVEWREDVRP